jgi:hypothetical protein
MTHDVLAEDTGTRATVDVLEGSSSIVRGPASPDELLRAFLYGGQIH